MRQHRLVRRITSWRTLCSIAAVAVVAVGAALSGGDAQGRVDPSTQQPSGTQLSPDTVGLDTGGGTVTVTAFPTNILASFGINAKRPPGFTPPGTNGAALGRINYDKHAQVAGRHVNVPVTFMQVELSQTPSPNGTGGKAQLIGDCTQAGTECPTQPPGIQSVLVYVEDNSDTANTADVFRIQFCTDVASASPSQITCSAPEGGPIRTGQIQIRPSAGGGATVPTAAQAPRLRP